MHFEIGQEVFLKESRNDFQTKMNSWVHIMITNQDVGVIEQKLWQVRPTFLVRFTLNRNCRTTLTVKVLGNRLTTLQRRVTEALVQ